jgi:hypothetical protein
MLRSVVQLALGAILLIAAPAWARGVDDPYFGEALYFAHQQQYFEALQRLDTELAQHYAVDEPELDSLYPYIGHAEFSVGDFELHYRMHHRAGRAIQAVLEGDVPLLVRNEAAYRLAKIHFQKDQPFAALRALDRIEGEVPPRIREDVEFLRANVYLAVGRSADAVEVLEGLQSADSLKGFSAYNLGIALMREGRHEDAVRQLDRAGRTGASDPATLAIRDKSNLVLGTLMFEAAEYERSQDSLDRVRLAGPFSNQALLRSGWASVSGEKFDRALVPWKILSQREPTDPAVQEALLALPFAYSKLEVHGRAARLYERAVGSFGTELEKVDESIRSIRMGEFLKALSREEIRQDKDWVIHLRSLPDAPETFYLTQLMAAHYFQTGLQNYLDLEDLRRKLLSWERSFDSFEDIIRLRKQYYEPLLPGIDSRFRKLDAQIRLRLEQRKHIHERLEHMLIAPRPDYLATSSEQRAHARLVAAREALEESSGPGREALERRMLRLEGVLRFTLETRYHERLTEAHAHLRELNRDVDALTEQYESFVRVRQAASHSYVGYDDPIKGLRMRVRLGLERLELLMARQGHLLETVAIAELNRRRDRLEAYQNQARFAFADSYDRAAKAQGEAQLQEEAGLQKETPAQPLAQMQVSP